MAWKKAAWIDESSGEDGSHLREDRLTHFGYRKVPADQKGKLVRRHFDTVAKRYDLMNTLLSFGIHHLWKRTAIRMSGVSPGDLVIDVCGGTGDLSILAAGAGAPSSRIILYDINRAMMEMGRPKVAGSGFEENITCVQGDAEHISFPDGIFDIAMVGFGIRNLTNMEIGLREMHRVLRPGGTLLCLEFSKPTSRMFRWLYDFYSFYIMPLLGGLIAGSIKAYTHLPESIRMFSLPSELSGMLEGIGFVEIQDRSLTNGIATLHLAKK
jgi:demethylmenaquinone methyltransferase/2-methoxy-6-polyprenyl-1,4-benzoquinol methylase